MIDYVNGYGMSSMPTATQPYGYPYNPYLQQPQMQPQQPMRKQQVDTNKIFVNGIEDVRMRVLPPNSEYIFLDNEKSMLYQKKVDANGQFEVKAYEITECKGDTATIAQQSIDLSNYVPRNEFEALQGEFRALQDKFSKITVRSTATNGATSQSASQPKATNGI